MNKAKLAWEALKLPPGEELDCLVLEHFMGWKPEENGSWRLPTGIKLCHNTLFNTGMVHEGSCCKPSEDAEAALWIWEESYNRGWSLVIGKTHDEKESWFGRLEKEAGLGYSFVHGISLGHVVCRAALTILLGEK